MAILQGFPASNTISPSIRITEQDLSYVSPNQSFHQAGLIGFASKGPINLPTLISSTRQLTIVFGNPHPEAGDPYLIYAAKQYLLVANQLFVVRVADTDPVSDEQATVATVDVPAAGGVIEIESASAGPYTFDVDSFFRWSLNGVVAQKPLVVLAGTYNVDDLVADLNDQIDTENDGIIFYETTINTIGVKTIWAYGPDSSLEFISVQDSIYGGTFNSPNPTGLGTAMTTAQVTGTLAMYPNVGYQTPGQYDFTGLTGLNLQIVVDGTDNVLIDGIVQLIDLADLEGQVNSISDIVTEINSQLASNAGTLPGGWICEATGNNLKFSTLTYGVDSRMRIKASSTAAAIFGLSTLTVTGDTPSGVTGDVDIATLGLVSGSVNSDGSLSFVVSAESPGIEGNLTQVVVSNTNSNNQFSIQVFNNGVPVESWGRLNKDPSSSFYVETYIQLVSQYITVVDNASNGAGPLGGTYTLVGGSDGIPSDPDDQDHLLIGSEVGATGIYTLGDTEQVNIDLIAIPGHSSTAVVMALLSFCQSTRQDCLAIIDPPFGLTVNEIVAWQNGSHPLNLTRFDSDFGALYWPWVRLYDLYNQIDVWCPPSGSIMAVIAKSDFLSAPWFAPAGLNRGLVPAITGVYSRPSLQERDLMYGNNNCVNPIVQFTDIDGYVVFGQKTLQRQPTALDRVNVRRLMFFLEKSIRSAVRGLLFDPNDSVFQGKFTSIVNGILNEVRVGRGLYDYIVVADGTLNTPDVISRNEFHAQIGVQPEYAVEFMFIEFSINTPGNNQLPPATSF